MQGNSNQLNQRAIEVLCNEIMKAVEVKTKRIVADALKSAGKTNGASALRPTIISSPYPVGSYCILQKGISPNDYWSGEWTKINGDIYIVENYNDEEIQWSTPGAVIWRRIR